MKCIFFFEKITNKIRDTEKIKSWTQLKKDYLTIKNVN